VVDILLERDVDSILSPPEPAAPKEDDKPG
jgi:hypothetical protein